MESLSEVSLSEFREALTLASVRISQIIYSALAAGIITFVFVISMIYLRQADVIVYTGVIRTIKIMSYTNIIITISAIFTSKFISDRKFNSSNLQSAIFRDFTDDSGNSVQLTPAQKCLAIIRTASIIRLGILEGAAFLGLIILLLTVKNGIGISEPVYYANGLSIIPLLTYIVVTFPTAEKIEKTFIDKIQATITK